MKIFTEAPAKWDRTSTREELYQVIEMLGGRRASRAVKMDSAEMYDEASSSERPEELWSQVTRDEELALAAEIEPLADLFLGKDTLVN